MNAIQYLAINHGPEYLFDTCDVEQYRAMFSGIHVTCRRKAMKRELYRQFRRRAGLFVLCRYYKMTSHHQYGIIATLIQHLSKTYTTSMNACKILSKWLDPNDTNAKRLITNFLWECFTYFHNMNTRSRFNKRYIPISFSQESIRGLAFLFESVRSSYDLECK